MVKRFLLDRVDLQASRQSVRHRDKLASFVDPGATDTGLPFGDGTHVSASLADHHIVFFARVQKSLTW